jgi:hypothetical protein
VQVNINSLHWFFEKKTIHLKKINSAVNYSTVFLKKNCSFKKVNSEEEKQSRAALIKLAF